MLIWVRMGDAGGVAPSAAPVKTTVKKAASKAKKAEAAEAVSLPDADPVKAVKK